MTVPVPLVVGGMPLLSAALGAILIALNWRFLRFAGAVHGPAFAVRSACLCWLIYVLSAVGVVFGLGKWVMEWSGLTEPAKGANTLLRDSAAVEPRSGHGR